MTAARHIGRFAPSPTGNLHFGSLLAALASCCEARAQGGRWLLRIDDIDGPRSVAGSADAIQRTLENFGFEWDGPVCWQSERMELYQSALKELVKQGRIFNCTCSRRSLPSGQPYPGHCRGRLSSNSQKLDFGHPEDHALRIRLSGNMNLDDAVQGSFNITLDQDVGDTIVRRRDGLVSYSLACAVDDGHDATQVVRGADLLESSAAQIGIMQALSLSTPSYAHLPIAVDQNGDKLSKHSKAQSIDQLDPLSTLLQAWRFLGQLSFTPESINAFWNEAPKLWQLDSIPRQKRLTL
ncbi:MAG: tRNA glutamyl-Q(34) synthetase GluQRS [Granulosicoccus sp.]